MKKVYVIIILSFFTCFLLTGQNEKDTRYYNLNPEDGKILDGTYNCSMDMQNTSEGTVIVEFGNQQMKGKIKEFSASSEIKDIRKKKFISREFVKKRRKTITEINGQVNEDKDESGMEGKTALFSEKDNVWVLENKEDFTEKSLVYLNDLYNPTDRESELILYPKKIEIGETVKLTDDNFSKSNDENELTTGKGTIKLLKVETINGERIATLDIDCTITSADLVGDDRMNVTTSFQGQVKRSLDSFLDIESNFKTTMTMLMEQFENDIPKMKVTITFDGVMKASGSYSK